MHHHYWHHVWLSRSPYVPFDPGRLCMLTHSWWIGRRGWPRDSWIQRLTNHPFHRVAPRARLPFPPGERQLFRPPPPTVGSRRGSIASPERDRRLTRRRGGAAPETRWWRNRRRRRRQRIWARRRRWARCRCRWTSCSCRRRCRRRGPPRCVASSTASSRTGSRSRTPPRSSPASCRRPRRAAAAGPWGPGCCRRWCCRGAPPCRRSRRGPRASRGGPAGSAPASPTAPRRHSVRPPRGPPRRSYRRYAPRESVVDRITLTPLILINLHVIGLPWTAYQSIAVWQFYFQDGRPPPYEVKKQCISTVEQLFAGHSNGLRAQGALKWFIFLLKHSDPFFLLKHSDPFD